MPYAILQTHLPADGALSDPIVPVTLGYEHEEAPGPGVNGIDPQVVYRNDGKVRKYGRAA